MMLSVFGFWVTLASGTICLRYRDLAQVVAVATQMTFLVTPIFWKVQILADQQWLATCNPIFHLLEICRAPMLGKSIPWSSWGAVTVLNVAGCLIAFAVFARCRRRLAYWM
jgi:lipopolysaccharide transport system permease protein